jgi:GT2 family glycosyltransferase
MGLFGSGRKKWPIEPLAPAVKLDGPPLAVIVITYEMSAQLANTLRTLVSPYQQQVDTNQYEVVVVDNGSANPLPDSVWNAAGNVRYHHIPKSDAPPNPGAAINKAVANTTSPLLCIMIDGARMVTPGVLRWGMDLARFSQKTLVEIRGWHLGPKVQMQSVLEGYNAEVERGLLNQVDWPKHPYRLFEIAAPAASMKRGFLGLAAECTCLFISRSLFDQIGGYDERYREPGGGLCNADFFVRAVQASDRVFTVLGEGTFHQIHGGAATGLSGENSRGAFRRWKAEYEKLSRPWHSQPVDYELILAGHLPAEARRWLLPRKN